MDEKFTIKDGILTECNCFDEIAKIPSGVTTIEENALYGTFKEIVFPDSVNLIKSQNGLNSIRKVTISSKFLSSSKNLFKGTGIRNAEFVRSFEELFLTMNNRIEEIIFTGNEKELDFSKWDDSYFHSYNKPIVRCNNEITSIIIPERFSGHFYINNYIEKVNVNGSDKWTDERLIFRAPLPNKKRVNGNLLELTLNPRASYSNDKRWSCPVTIKADAITHIYPAEMKSYESDKHQGCMIAMAYGYEHTSNIIVWESYDFVLDKLTKAGWNIPMGKTQGLPPLECDDPEILIIGTFPGISSLESGEYYHDNTNRIWEVLCKIYNDYPVPTNYEDKQALLARHRIVLWDYYKTASRKNSNSSDKSLVGLEPNDIIDFLKKYPTIRKIAINGYGKYDSWGKKLIKAIADDPVLKSRNIQVFRLPETSGLNTRYNVEKLAKEWEIFI